MVANVERELGPVEFVVNNAGVHQALGLPWEVDPDDWWREIEVNLRSAFLVSRFVLPGMVERGHGRVVNVASGAAFDPRPVSSAYAASKAGMLRLTDSTELALAGTGVHVFAIHPGGVFTGLTEGVMASEAGSGAYSSWKDATWRDPALAAAICFRIATGEFDPLAGRFLDVTGDLDAALADSAGIVARDGLTMRLRP
jgi:NAD(P)-dependent dehydrogenase (short-subunit alcohol dehydrogenase family)